MGLATSFSPGKAKNGSISQTKRMEALKGQAYDIIIVDYKLPGINGLEFLKRIQGYYPHTIKIIISAYGNKKVISEAIGIGVQDFIEKPFTTKTIEESLSRLLQDQKSNRTDIIGP